MRDGIDASQRLAARVKALRELQASNVEWQSAKLNEAKVRIEQLVARLNPSMAVRDAIVGELRKMREAAYDLGCADEQNRLNR